MHKAPVSLLHVARGVARCLCVIVETGCVVVTGEKCVLLKLRINVCCLGMLQKLAPDKKEQKTADQHVLKDWGFRDEARIDFQFPFLFIVAVFLRVCTLNTGDFRLTSVYIESRGLQNGAEGTVLNDATRGNDN